MTGCDAYLTEPGCVGEEASHYTFENCINIVGRNEANVELVQQTFESIPYLFRSQQPFVVEVVSIGPTSDFVRFHKLFKDVQIGN